MLSGKQSREVLLRFPEDHQCNALHPFKRMQIFDQKGLLRECCVQFCEGEEPSVSLLRHGIWASSAKKPTRGVHISLMWLLYSFVINNRVSLFRACNAIQFSGRLFSTEETASLYETVNRYGSFGRFRKFYQCVWLLKGPQASDRIDVSPLSCLACSKEKTGNQFMSFDACFKLVHKLKSRKAPVGTAFESQFFCDQKAVKEYVDSSSTEMDSPNNDDCSEFSAGDLAKASQKNKRLGVRGVFGSSCRHQFPLKFCDMAHGERFAYPRFMLKALKNDYPDKNIILLYDIGCQFAKNVAKWEPELSENLTVRIPVLHSYAHNLLCQVIYWRLWAQLQFLVDDRPFPEFYHLKLAAIRSLGMRDSARMEKKLLEEDLSSCKTNLMFKRDSLLREIEQLSPSNPLTQLYIFHVHQLEKEMSKFESIELCDTREIDLSGQESGCLEEELDLF